MPLLQKAKSFRESLPAQNTVKQPRTAHTGKSR